MINKNTALLRSVVGGVDKDQTFYLIDVTNTLLNIDFKPFVCF